MPYSLGIMIDGTRITDLDAKIIGLLIRGLSNPQIFAVLFIKPPTIYNHCTSLYGLLGIEHCTNALTYRGQKNGYDLNCHVNGNDVLDEDERRRLSAFPQH